MAEPEGNVPAKEPSRFSRRQVLAAAGAGVVGGAVVGVGAGYALDDGGSSTTTATPATTAAATPATTSSDTATAASNARPLMSLSAIEGTALVAMLSRLIPSDDTGPGADEAMTWRFIDRELSGELSATRGIYSAGLAALDELAVAQGADSFATLDAAKQDAILTDVQGGKATGAFLPDSGTFFATVHEHALQGTFGDPIYGGNADDAGWKLIGYPGYRMVVTEAEQGYDPKFATGESSTYDDSMFGLAPAKGS
jgi:gluconate 2-dehydrogenase gamma chain